MKKYSGRYVLCAEFEALSPDETLNFDLDFDFGEDGFYTSSPNTLYSITVEYNELPQDNQDKEFEEEEIDKIEDVEEEKIEEEIEKVEEEIEEDEFDAILLLEENHFVCDNFIFYFKKSKRIYETYIQDDKYFIISELVIDEKEHCVHRVRVGKIPSDSWMFWQMLREKIDNLQSIDHYGANYTVFHYRVFSKDETIKDKYFDYKGREIENPVVVKTQYNKAIAEGKTSDYIDVPVSKASFEIDFEGSFFTVYRNIKGVRKTIARMMKSSKFGQSYEIDLAIVNLERKKKGLPEIKGSPVNSCVYPYIIDSL